MLRNILFMSLTTGVKLLSGIFVFVLLATVLGAHSFGVFSYAFTLASILSLVVDYGYSQQILRDVSSDSKVINSYMGIASLAKLTLLSFCIIIALLFCIFTDSSSAYIATFWLLFFSCILNSYGEFLNTAFRATNKFNNDTKVATLSSLAHIVIVIAALFVFKTVEACAVAFLISKALYFFLSLRAYHHQFGKLDFNHNFQEIVSNLKAGFPYCADIGITNLFYQIDTVIIKAYLGLTAVGMYQAAMKWLQGVLQFAPVLSNVYLPTLSKNKAVLDSFRIYTVQLNNKMLFIGTLGWGFFVLIGDKFGELVYGTSYGNLHEVWKSIGILIFVRFIAGSQGIILVSQGLQRIRVLAQIVSFIILLSLASILVPLLGIDGMVISIIFSIFSLFVSFVLALKQKKIPIGYEVFSGIWVLLMIVASLYVKIILKNG